MKVNVELELLPFNVPNYVLVKEEPRPKQEGFAEGKKFHISELGSETLLKLCNQFKNDVFRKAGKEHPPMVANEEE